jgi:uncharacterized protein
MGLAMSQAPAGIESLADRLSLDQPENSLAAPQNIKSSTVANLNTTKPNLLTTLATQLRYQYQERLDRIILFGSHARGEATSDSDIDVLIVLKEPVNPTIELQQTSQLTAQLCLEHNVLISRIFMSRSRYETEQSPLLKNIRREGILL